MRINLSLLVLAASTLSSALPQPVGDIAVSQVASRTARSPFSSAYEQVKYLFKRKGGGGGGGRGSGGGSSSGGSSSGGSSSGGSSSGGSRPAGSSSSASGGRTSAGTGVTPAYGGGRYYSGGASVPYSAGGRTPSGLLPVALLGVGALAFFPGVWGYGAYSYPYSHPYTFHNISSGHNETKPVNCLCQQYQVCGCDDNSNNTTFLDSLIGNGSYATLPSTVKVADYKGTNTIFVNGSLANGTTAASAGSTLQSGLMHIIGYWMMAALVAAIVMLP
ncbi:MAG: hypothetical protein M1818_002065 [Claussenomyces sp. TS43310]|nr:MAG: hypothetical protein M1818_002065 [Claussenomyces sp. TS43310]